jgi:hypothetical protein
MPGTAGNKSYADEDQRKMADMKPKAPPCTGNQFSELPQFQNGYDPGVPWPAPDENYYDVKFDENNNVIAEGKYNILPENSTAQEGQFGSKQFADSSTVNGLRGVNNYGPEDANPGASTVWVDNSRADRGRDV